MKIELSNSEWKLMRRLWDRAQIGRASCRERVYQLV